MAVINNNTHHVLGVCSVLGIKALFQVCYVDYPNWSFPKPSEVSTTIILNFKRKKLTLKPCALLKVMQDSYVTHIWNFIYLIAAPVSLTPKLYTAQSQTKLCHEELGSG